MKFVNPIKVTGDSSCTEWIDVGGDFTALEPGFISSTTGEVQDFSNSKLYNME